MIPIVEVVLEKGFNMLPAMRATGNTPNGFKPYYAWGNEFHLVRQMYLKNEGLYPLIYQTSNRETHNTKPNTVTSNLTLVLAVDNPQQEELNESRWAESYNNVLFPLLNNIITLFTKGNVFLWGGEFTITKIPNYKFEGRDIPTSGKQNIEIWDAILLEVNNLTIDGNKCLQQTIKF